MAINPNRLRELRKRKKLSRQDLANRSRLSARTIHRLESNPASSKTARERTINGLAEALGIEPGVLTDELPIPEDISTARPGEGKQVQMSAFVTPEVRLAYDLIKRRYGITATTISNLGPLMFTLLAEGSLAWRRRKVKEVEEAAERLYSMGAKDGHLSVAFAAYRALEGVDGEEESIDKRDLFGEEVSEEAFQLGYDRSTHNPFADYLREFTEKVGNPSVILLDPSYEEVNTEGSMKGFPDYIVCLGELQEIAGGSTAAHAALSAGHARIKDIPDELWAENAGEQRAQWLEKKIPARNPNKSDQFLDLTQFIKSPEGDREEDDQ